MNMEVKVERLQSQKILHQLIGDYQAELKQAREAGRPVAWASIMGPTELLSAMGYSIFYPENYAATCGTRGVSTEFCEKAENLDYAQDICGYIRTWLGSALTGETAKCPIGGVPRPDLLITPNYCTDIVKSFEALSQFYGAPLIVTDTPLVHDGTTAEERRATQDYQVEQLKDVVSTQERLTKRRLDYDRLQEQAATTEKMAAQWNRIMAMSKHIPAPLNAFDHFVHVFPIATLRGDPRGVAYYEKLEAELQERVRQGIGSLPRETYRLYLHGLPAWFRLREIKAKFASYEAAVVIGIYQFSWAFEGFDASKPLESLAHQATDHIMNQGVQSRANFVARLVQDYSVDGMVFPYTKSCKLVSVGTPDVFETAREKTGVPGVAVESDMCDARMFSEADFNSKIESFMEVLATRPRRR